ncbi:MAG: hypothetical protein GY839_00770 [candidate division Zixibacteria bacterium]|nr:hypothetical protein [candidate division Zixibacteria bacterium]
MTKTSFRLIMTSILIIIAGINLHSETLVNLDNPDLDEVLAIGIDVKKAGEIDIDAVGISLRYRDDFSVYSWIIDHETRELVWVMKERHTDRVRGSRALYREETTRDFKPGKYELYLYSGSSLFSNISIHGTGDIFEFLGDIFGDDYDRDLEDYLDECYVKLSSDKLTSNDFETFNVSGELPGSLLHFTKLGDEEYIQTGFKLDKDMSIRIYSVFEFPRDYKTPVDYGWIVNADTREKVWEITRWNTDWAGGGRKNRMHDDEVDFEKGEYLLYFVTDDSHSYDDFNSNPPYDPFNWGITLLPVNNSDRSAFHTFEPAGKGEPLINLTRARDDDFLEQPFKLKKATSLHIYAIGEYSFSDREFVDYGWIQNAATGETVWEMTYRNTGHAGGARKNRIFDDKVKMPKGEYIAYYMTDGSHSYRDWNDSPPFDPGAWGLAVYPNKDFNTGDFAKISKSDITKDSNILVKMVKARDRDRLRDKFTLTKQTRVHIYSIGEGDRDEMYDYGWIVDDRTNRSVWEMTWRNTEPAGGARKNRKYDENIILDPGTYEVNFITDGSHSFNDWNSPRPHDPINWGITISIIDN